MTTKCSKCTVTFPSLSNGLDDLRSRLRDTHPSSELDTKHVQDHLSAVETDLRSCDAELERLDIEILRINSARQRLEQRKTSCQALLAPIRKLSVDVLTTIFAQCTTTNELWQKRKVNRHGLVPTTLVLSAVCGSWRNLIQSTPLLWSNFTISSSSEIKHQGSLLMLLRLYIQHSHEHPLTFTISNNHPARTIHADVLTILCRHAERWRSVTLYIDNKSLQSEPFLNIQGRLPLLEELGITNTGNSPNLNSFTICPSLRRLKCGPTIGDTDVPWDQLEELVLYGQSAAGAVECCSRCPELRSLTISMLDSSKETNTREVLPSVTSLSLNLPSQKIPDNKSLTADAFNHLCLPALKELQIGSKGDVAFSWTSKAFRSFLKASYCSITSLVMDKVGISPSDFIKILAELPALTHLQVTGHPLLTADDKTSEKSKDWAPEIFDSKVLQALTYDEFRPSVVPALASLKVDVNSTEFEEQEFVDMVLSRFNWAQDAVQTLQTVYLNLQDVDPDEDIFQPLYSLRQYGLNVQVY